MSDFRIIYTNEDGGVSIVVPAPGVSQAEAMKAVPPTASAEVVHVSAISSDRTFRNAWEKNGRSIVHNIDKAKNIAHEKRRNARTAEFAPLDIEATIPAKAAQAEAKRQVIRNKYDTMQVDIDAATDIDSLKSVIAGIL